jgi:Mrp family chromosome partitioning ATPase
VRLSSSALPFAFVVALAVGGIVFVAGMRVGDTVEVVRVWTWVDEPGDPGEVVAALQSRALRADAAQRLAGRPPTSAAVEDVARWTRVAVQDPSSDVEVRVDGATEVEATARERAVAQALVAWDGVRGAELQAAELAAAQERVEVLTERIRSVQVLGAAATDGDVDALIEERDAAVARFERASQALATGAVGRLTPLPAVARTRVPAPWRAAGLAAMLAFGMAIMAGLRPSAQAPEAVRERMRERAAGRSRAPTPPPAVRAPAPDEALAAFPYAGGEDPEALRSVATALVGSLREPLAGARTAVVLVTSLHDGEGKTTVATQLAEALARAGARTLLVDGSLWAPALAERYGVVVGGDEEVVAGSEVPRIASTLDWMQRPEGRHHVVGVELGQGHRLDLVPQFRATRPAPGTAETLFEAFGDALGRWRGYEVVVVDAAALATVADTRYLLPFATGVVLVVDRRRDDRRRRAEALKLLRAANARLLGVVIDEPPVPEAPAEPDEAARAPRPSPA